MIRSFHRRLRQLWLPVSLCCLFLVGCGQKGDLYIPEEQRDRAGQGTAD